MASFMVACIHAYFACSLYFLPGYPFYNLFSSLLFYPLGHSKGFPYDASVYKCKGNALSHLGRLTEAQQLYEKAKRLETVKGLSS